MKRALLLLLVLSSCRATAQRRAGTPLRVEPFYFDAILHSHAAAYTGISCTYSLPGDDTLLLFACSFSTRTGAVMVNGRVVELRQDSLTAGRSGDRQRRLRFASKRYRLELVVDDAAVGEMTVTDVPTGRRWKSKVAGTCSI